jgi:hypothetical protein
VWCSTHCPRPARRSSGPHAVRPTIETIYGHELDDPSAIGVVRGIYEFDEGACRGTRTRKHFSAMGGWISSTLVKLGDLKFSTATAST